MTTKRHLRDQVLRVLLGGPLYPTPDPAGLARWIDRAHRLLASGQIG